MKVLIMGLPGAGKTTLAEALYKKLDNCSWYNADELRKKFNDWDFSPEGRLRQANRMKDLSENDLKNNKSFVICDFVAPTDEIRAIFDADFVIWMNTIERGRFEDTNRVFQNPSAMHIVINDFNYSIDDIVKQILNHEQSKVSHSRAA